MPDEAEIGPDGAIEAHGFDPRFTPIDTLMNGPVAMGLQYAFDLEYGNDA